MLKVLKAHRQALINCGIKPYAKNKYSVVLAENLVRELQQEILLTDEDKNIKPPISDIKYIGSFEDLIIFQSNRKRDRETTPF